MATRCRPAAACALEARRQAGRAPVPTPRVGTQPVQIRAVGLLEAQHHPSLFHGSQDPGDAVSA